MNIFPLMALGAVAYAVTRKRRSKRRRAIVTNGNGATNNPALSPANNGPGEVFAGDGDSPPDVIMVKVGTRFTISLRDIAGTPYSWSLKASPPDDSVRFVEKKYEELERPEGMAGGAAGIEYYVFEGAKPGKGSLVFHLQTARLEGQAPPYQVLEIQTIIS